MALTFTSALPTPKIGEGEIQGGNSRLRAIHSYEININKNSIALLLLKNICYN